jgi:hypothetical protein
MTAYQFASRVPVKLTTRPKFPPRIRDVEQRSMGSTPA